MPRITVWFKDSDKYVSLNADRFYEYDSKYKAINGEDIVGIFDVDSVRSIYLTHEKPAKK